MTVTVMVAWVPVLMAGGDRVAREGKGVAKP